MVERERRRYRRIGFHRPVDITSLNGKSHQYIAHDFSMMGIGIESEKPHQIGEKMRVRFRIAPNGESSIMDLMAEVKYSSFREGYYLTGLEFNRRSKVKQNT